MTGDRRQALLDALVRHVFRDRITAPNADDGIELLAGGAACDASADEWRAALADALAAGYLYDPVRLPEGALQCHWHLELTPLGVEQTRKDLVSLVGIEPGNTTGRQLYGQGILGGGSRAIVEPPKRT